MLRLRPAEICGVSPLSSEGETDVCCTAEGLAEQVLRGQAQLHLHGPPQPKAAAAACRQAWGAPKTERARVKSVGG